MMLAEVKSMSLVIQQPEKVDEPVEAKGFADVISRVAAEGQPVIMRREGTDVDSAALLSGRIDGQARDGRGTAAVEEAGPAEDRQRESAAAKLV
jgi:hypothetical protein